MPADANRDLLFGMLALQNGMVTRDQLVAAFGVWTGAPGRSIAECLVDQRALTPIRRALLDALAAEHLAAHGGDPEASLAALEAASSTRDTLGRLAGLLAGADATGSPSETSGPTTTTTGRPVPARRDRSQD